MFISLLDLGLTISKNNYWKPAAEFVVEKEALNNPPTPLSVERGRLHGTSLLPTKPANQTLLPASLASPASSAAQRPNQPASRAASQSAIRENQWKSMEIYEIR